MRKERARAIIKKDENILVIHRVNEQGDYYVFPGGAIKKNEDPSSAVAREVAEETSLEICVGKLFATYQYKSLEYYFLCQYVSGVPHLRPNSGEARVEDGNNKYEFEWIDTRKLKDLLLYPSEIRDRLIEEAFTK